MDQIILIFHLLFAVALIALILVQQGKGAGMGASFGAGASQTVFGSKGSGGFLLKLTGGLAILFFLTSLSLSFLANREAKMMRHNSALQQAAQISQMAQPKQQVPPPSSPLHAAIPMQQARSQQAPAAPVKK